MKSPRPPAPSGSPRDAPPSSSSPRSAEEEHVQDVLVIPTSKNNHRAASVAREAGRKLYQQGLFKESVAQFEKACKLDSHNAINFELCVASMLMDPHSSPGEIKGKLMRAKELAPYSAWSNVLLCKLALRKAKVEEVSASTDRNLLLELLAGYTEAVKLEPGRYGAAERLQEVEKLCGKDAKSTFVSEISPEIATQRAEVVKLMSKKKWAEAFKWIKGCCNDEPQNPKNWVLRSLILSKCKAKGNPAEVAVVDANRALRLQNGHAEAWLALGVAYAKLGSIDWAIEAIDEGFRQDAPTMQIHEDDVAKIRKQLLKTKHAQHRPEPWQYSDGPAPTMAGELRSEPVLEVDSMGEMTIRSQFKRVLMAHQTRNPEIKLMSNEQKPVHVAMSDLKDPSVIGSRPKSPRNEQVVSPRHALRPTAVSAKKSSSPQTIVPEMKKREVADTSGEIGEEASQ